jgi:hypothetical protein
VLANQEAANAASIVNQVSRVVLGLEEPTVRDLPMTPQDRRRYIGRYDIGRLQLHVLEDDDRLVLRGLGDFEMRLLAQGEHVFRARFDPSVRVVFQVEGDQSQWLVLHQLGTAVEGRRVE